ncbi:unnamed protein product, partial [Symbiodinium sp. CCMP2456]
MYMCDGNAVKFESGSQTRVALLGLSYMMDRMGGYTSAHFEQGAGRHACNNPYNKAAENKVFQEMQQSKLFQITHAKFLEIIKPSFLAIDEDEDFDAILARTHIILLTDNGVYYRLASTPSKPVDVIPWEHQRKDLLGQPQHAIYKTYKCGPTNHRLPPNFSADMAWSQEFLRRVLAGEPVPGTPTILCNVGLFEDRDA